MFNGQIIVYICVGVGVDVGDVIRYYCFDTCFVCCCHAEPLWKVDIINRNRRQSLEYLHGGWPRRVRDFNPISRVLDKVHHNSQICCFPFNVSKYIEV